MLCALFKSVRLHVSDMKDKEFKIVVLQELYV